MRRGTFSRLASRVGEGIRAQIPNATIARQIKADPQAVPWPQLLWYVENSRWYSPEERVAALSRRKDVDAGKAAQVLVRNKADQAITDRLLRSLPEKIEYSEIRDALPAVKTLEQWKRMRRLFDRVGSISFKDAIEDLNSSRIDAEDQDFAVELHVRLKSIVASKLYPRPTWRECVQISDAPLRDIAYRGVSAFTSRPHAFLNELQHQAAQPENSDLIYVELLEKGVEKACDEVMREMRQEDLLHSFSADDVRAGSQKLAALTRDMLTAEESVQLESAGISMKESLLTLYLRYGSGVQYGAVADALAICTDRFIAERCSQFFIGTRVVPAKEGYLFGPEFRQILPATRIAPVTGSMFKSLLKAGVTIYGSHGKDDGGFLRVYSAGMQRPDPENKDVVLSPIELEETEWHPEIRDPGNFTRTSHIKDIIRVHFLVLLEIDKKIRNKIYT